MLGNLTARQQELLTTLQHAIDEGSIGVTGSCSTRYAGERQVGIRLLFGESRGAELPEGWDKISQRDFEAFIDEGFIEVTRRTQGEIDFKVRTTTIRHALQEKDMTSFGKSSVHSPIEIQLSLNTFRTEFPDADKTAFIIMRFGKTPAHEGLEKAIKDTLRTNGLGGMRADDKRYHDDLFPNVMTYMHGCGFGIAIYERIETEEFNPNVALEVGYMRAIGKPVCLLKDRTLKALPTDLMGKLYDEFDTQDPARTIPPALTKWLNDKGLA